MTTQMPIASPRTEFYERAFGGFHDQAVAEVRKETYGEDLGQNDWSTVDEMRQFSQWLELSPQSHLLDVCSGSGGPALFLARNSGCRVTGVDLHPTPCRPGGSSHRRWSCTTGASSSNAMSASACPFPTARSMRCGASIPSSISRIAWRCCANGAAC